MTDYKNEKSRMFLFVFLFLNQSNHVQLSAGLPDQHELTIGVATLSWRELQKSPEQSSHSHTFHGKYVISLELSEMLKIIHWSLVALLVDPSQSPVTE